MNPSEPRKATNCTHAVRISLASAGVWWGVFTFVPLLSLRTRQVARTLPAGAGSLTAGFAQLRETFGKARLYPQTLLFLLAYLLYNDGIQTVIALASQFGQEELGLSIATLTSVILLVLERASDPRGDRVERFARRAGACRRGAVLEAVAAPARQHVEVRVRNLLTRHLADRGAEVHALAAVQRAKSGAGDATSGPPRRGRVRPGELE